jgi:S-layer protein (TIGR01564 family)
MLALFLGRLGAKAAVRLDTEVREKELEDNLICIGGPVTNLITARFVEQMPIRFATKDSWAIVSKISGEEYGEDTNGLIVRIPNPLKKGKSVLILAGKGIEGTRAAVIALAKHPNLRWHNLHDKANFAKVVEGVDLDGDGIVDDVEVRE